MGTQNSRTDIPPRAGGGGARREGARKRKQKVKLTRQPKGGMGERMAARRHHSKHGSRNSTVFVRFFCFENSFVAVLAGVAQA